jgi:hypothetical protein
MRLKHNVPARVLRSDPITPEYQAQVDRATSKAMVAYERAQRRLKSAESRLARAQSTQSKKKSAQRELAIALELVELRREELRRIEALMTSVPASAEHRGTRSFRPVPALGSRL